jgi:hypothetical protein
MLREIQHRIEPHDVGIMLRNFGSGTLRTQIIVISLNMGNKGKKS